MPAGNITLTAQRGVGPSPTFFGNRTDMVAAGKKTLWTKLGAGRKSPWEILQYPGSSSIRAKFMGSKPMYYVLQGKVFDDASIPTVATVRTEMEAVADLNKLHEFYKISAAQQIIHRGEGMIVEDVIFEFLGMGTGPEWGFNIYLKDLGID